MNKATKLFSNESEFQFSNQIKDLHIAKEKA